MKLNTRHKVLGAVGATALVIGVGAALAVTKNGSSNQRQTFFNAANVAAQPSAFPSGRLPRFGSRLGGPMHKGPLGHDAFVSGVADYLGLTSSQLRTKIESGDTLAAIAKAQGKTVDGLKTAIVDLTKKQLDKAVAAKKLTQAQASQIQSRIQSDLDRLVNRSAKDGPPAGGFGGPMHDGPLGHDAFVSGVADYLGLTSSQLRTKIESGDTLAAIAKAQGKTVDGLKTAIVDLTKKQLDKAVAAKDLTQAQASQILSRIQSNLDTLVNRSPQDGPPAGMPGGMHGPPMGMPGATGTLGPPTGMPSSAPPMGSGI